MTANIWQNRVFLALTALIAIVGVAVMPKEVYPGDPMTMREETRAILLRREMAVSDFVVRDYLTTGDTGQYIVDNPNNGRSYSKYGSMAAWFYLLPMGVERLIEGSLPPFFSPRRVLYLNIFNIIMSLLVAASLFRTAERFGAVPWVAATFVGICFYATFLWNYLRAQNSEIMQLLLFCWAVAAFLDIVDARRKQVGSRGGVIRLWLACGALLLMKVSYLPLGPMFAVGLLAERMMREPGSWLSDWIAEASVHVLPACLAVGAWLGINTIKFGAPWRTGYHVWNAQGHGFNGDLLNALYQLLFTVQWGLGFCFPVLFLALPFIPRWLRQDPVRYGTLFGIGVTYLVLIGMLPTWQGEWCYGPRYWIFVLPFVSLPAIDAIRWLAGGAWLRRAVLAMVAVGLLYSVTLQWQVHRYPFFTIYQLLSPLDRNLTSAASRYFAHRSYGRILWDFSRSQDRLTELPWWKETKAKLNPVDAAAYEEHVRGVLKNRNFYWDWLP